MKRWYSVRLVSVLTRRHPIVFFGVLAAAGYALYRFLMTFTWFHGVFTFLTLMFSSEIGASRLYAEGKSFLHIISAMLLAYILNILLDYLIVTYALKWHWSKYILDAFSRRGKAFVKDVKGIFNRLRRNGAKTKRNAIGRFAGKLNGYAAHPSKAGLWAVFFLSLLPRIPFLPGGVGVAILIIRYNKLGFRGVLCLAFGICVHATYVLGSIYGVGALYSLLVH